MISSLRFVRVMGLVMLLGLTVFGSLYAAGTESVQKSAALIPDPAVKYGSLPNGMRYAVMANAEPKGRASFRLMIESGSFNEVENQRGLAHFLEHLAFNGSTHFPPGTLVEFFQRMGMSFGGDTNAFTSFDRTQYMLELADTKEATIAEGLRVFSDYAGGLLLASASVDKERGIILSEKRARDSVGFRTLVAQLQFHFDTTLLPKRLPIGEVEVIEKAPRERLVEYYNTWYRPELMTVVVVGDFDAAAIEKQIVATFADFKARAPARAKADLGRLAPTPGVHARFHAEVEAPATSISISVLSPYAYEEDTAEKRLKDLPREIALSILNRRFSELAKKEGAPFTSAHCSIEDAYDLYRSASVDITCKADQWSSALAVGEQELRRALEHGFQQAELREVCAAFENSLEQAVKMAATRRSPNLASSIASGVKEREVFTSPAFDLALLRPALEKITVEECLAALRKAWNFDHRYVFVTGNAVLGAKADEEIAAVYSKSLATPVAAPAVISQVAWAYTDFGTPGKVVKRETVADLDLTLVSFANGVRLNIKKTAFEAGSILLIARVGDGAKTEPADKRGLAQIAGATFDAGGLGKHSVDELRRILSGKNVGWQFRPDASTFEFQGRTTPADLALELQLLAAKITDPGYRPEALRQARKSIQQLYLGFAHTPNGPLSTEVGNLLASGDPRFGLPEKEVLLSRTLEEAKAWLKPALSQGAIEIGIAGDLDIDATIDAVSKTLGALPQRGARQALPELCNVKFPEKPFLKNYTIDSEIPKGLAVYYWPTTDALDAHLSRRVNLLTSVFNDRLRVSLREKMGGTYSPRARNISSDTFPGYGYMNTGIDIDPTKAEQITAAVLEICTDMASKGVTEDELVRAKLPMMTGLRESGRTNAYWVNNVLSRAQEKPEVLDWARDREKDSEAITKAELDVLATRYLGADRNSRAIILPAAKPAATAKEPAPASAPVSK